MGTNVWTCYRVVVQGFGGQCWRNVAVAVLGRPGDTVEDADIPGGKASNPIDNSALDRRRGVGEAGAPEIPDIPLAGNWAGFLERR